MREYYALDIPQYKELTASSASYIGFKGIFTDGYNIYFVPYSNKYLVKMTSTSYTVSGLDISSLNAAYTSGGFIGGCTDGLYGYLAHNDYSGNASGICCRINLQNWSLTGATTLDYSSIDASCKGFWGAIYDGSYIYFVPNRNHGRIPRTSVTNFTSGGTTILNLESIDSSLKSFKGGFWAQDYIYLIPNNNGKFVRIRISDFSTVDVLDLTVTNVNLSGFNGGFYYDDHAYLIPETNSLLAKINLKTFELETYIDISSTGLSSTGTGFTDGVYGYILTSTGKITRFTLDFKEFETLDLSSYDSDFRNFFGGCTNDRFSYIVTNYNDKAKVLMFRTLNQVMKEFPIYSPFILNLEGIKSTLKGYGKPCADPHYCYLPPWYPTYEAVRINQYTLGVDYVNVYAVNTNYYSYTKCITDGKYIYYLPYSSYYMVRIDTQNFASGGVTGKQFTYRYNYYGCIVGKYGYMIQYLTNSGGLGGSVITKFDIVNFAAATPTYLNLATVNANYVSFTGLWSDGKYLYAFSITNDLIVKIDINNFTTGGVSLYFDSSEAYFGYLMFTIKENKIYNSFEATYATAKDTLDMSGTSMVLISGLTSVASYDEMGDDLYAYGSGYRQSTSGKVKYKNFYKREIKDNSSYISTYGYYGVGKCTRFSFDSPYTIPTYDIQHGYTPRHMTMTDGNL